MSILDVDTYKWISAPCFAKASQGTGCDMPFGRLRVDRDLGKLAQTDYTLIIYSAIRAFTCSIVSMIRG